MTTEPDGMENGDPREQSVESKKVSMSANLAQTRPQVRMKLDELTVILQGEKSSRDVRRDDEKRRKSR